jgi:hypothetical protein
MDPDIMRAAARQRLKDPEWKALAKLTKKRLKEGFYEEWARVFIDMSKPTYRLEEVSGFMLCWTPFKSNQIAFTRVIVGAKPDLDNPALNAAVLAKDQDDVSPFYAEYTEAGIFRFGWKKPIPFSVTEVTETEANEGLALLPPMRLRLQIGYIDVFDLIAMLSAWRGLARWPSDAETITVLQVIDPALWAPLSNYA